MTGRPRDTTFPLGQASCGGPSVAFLDLAVWMVVALLVLVRIVMYRPVKATS